jgi:hypothetical protein
MELFNSHYLDRARAKLSQTLSRFQRGSTKAGIPPETVKLIRGIAFLMGSCILAWLSIAMTREMTIIDYRASYRPSAGLWRANLRARGYMPIHTARERERLIRSPNAFSESQSIIQISPQLETLIFPRGSISELTEVWHREAQHPSIKTWTSIPNNLEGLEELQVLLEKVGPKAIPNSSAQPKFIDPKEIRY